ncbi:MAG: DUF4364 family protein [Clostridia bacterium]|nr:DUF4364 family protein [Clostridia bacterium]
MPAPLRDKNEIKIFILFLLDKIGYPLDYNTIGSIVVQDGIVRFFDFADCFFQLLDAGHIARASEDVAQLHLSEDADGEEQFEITDTGREVAHVLGENLMITVREQGERSALRHLSLKRLGAAVDQNYDSLGEGFMYHCSIKDKDGKVLGVDLRVDDRRRLERITKNFADRPEIIYRGILALLTGDVNYIFE